MSARGRFLWRYRLEYVVVVAIVYGVRAMSPAFAWSCARLVGRLSWRFGLRKRVAMTNLAIVFPDKTEAEREEIGRKTAEHFACMALDIVFQTRMLNPRNVLRKIEPTGWAANYMKEHGVEGLRRRAHGVLFLTAHIGNWELASGFFGLLGVDISPVFRPPRNPYVDKLIRSIRLDSQADFIEKRGAVKYMVETLERGGNVGFLFDQEAMHGLSIPFFGKEAPTHKTPGVLACTHRVKILFGTLVRKGDFLRYEARGELLEYNKEEGGWTIESITRDLMRRLEAEVLEHPEQYLWMHRRWKRVGAHGESHVSQRAVDRAAKSHDA